MGKTRYWKRILKDRFCQMSHCKGMWEFWFVVVVGEESEEPIHGVFDRRHCERVEEFETVEEFEPAGYPGRAQGFKMSPKAIM